MGNDALQQAVQLAKSGKGSEALPLLKNYIRQNPKDVRAWWLIANLVSDPKVKQESLKRVLILKPDHTKAKTMLAKIESELAPKPANGPDWLTAQIPAEDDKFPSTDGLGFDEKPAAPPPKQNADWLTAEIPDEEEEDAFPSMDAFGLGASQTTSTSEGNQRQSVDEKVLFENLQRKKLERQQAESGKHELDDRTWMYILGGVITIAAIIIGVLITVYYIQSRGPALDATARNSYLSIDYPDDWQAVPVGDYTMVVATSRISTADLNPWATMHDTDLRAYPYWLQYELEYWNRYYSAFYDFGEYDDPAELLGAALSGGYDYEEIDPESLLVVVVQALPDRENRGYSVQELVDAVGNDLKGGGFETEFYSYEQNVDVEKSDIEINGRQGTFTRMTFSSEFSFIGGSETFSSIYFATVQNGDIEYLFLFSASEEKAGKWEKTAKRMAESIEFFTPVEASS